MTVIDSLSTAIVMGEAEIVDQMLEYIPTIDFSTTEKPDETVSLFESTIRYLGGLVSGRCRIIESCVRNVPGL